MIDQALQWLDALPDMSIGGVTGVPGVPPQKTAGLTGTPVFTAGVPGVAAEIVGTPGTPLQYAGVTRKPAEILGEHREHWEHPQAVGLLAELAEGVNRLRARPGRLANLAEDWPQVMADARRLIASGLAAQALALGWDGYDLFGIGEGGGGEWAALSVSRDEWLSLAVWLGDRAVTMLDDHRAFTGSGQVYHLERHARPSTVFKQPIYLWEWGK